MNFIAYFQCNLLIFAIFGFFVASCFSQNTRALPESAIIRYAENGTPSYIKGENLSSQLDDDSQFRVLKEKGLYGDVVYQLL